MGKDDVWEREPRLEEFASAGAVIGNAARGRPYTKYYIRNVWRGKQKFTEALRIACWKVLGESLRRDGPSRNRLVRLPPNVNFVDGSLILPDSVLCFCGQWFIPKTPNQKYHTKDCKKAAYKARREQVRGQR